MRLILRTRACRKAYKICCKLFAGAFSPLQRPLSLEPTATGNDKKGSAVKMVTIRLGLQHPSPAMRIQAVNELAAAFDSTNAPAVSEWEAWVAHPHWTLPMCEMAVFACAMGCWISYSCRFTRPTWLSAGISFREGQVSCLCTLYLTTAHTPRAHLAPFHDCTSPSQVFRGRFPVRARLHRGH